MPTPPSFLLPDAQPLATSRSHSPAGRPDGTLRAWGDNHSHLLGQGYEGEPHQPIQLITATKFELNVKRTDNTASWGQTLLLDWIAIP